METLRREMWGLIGDRGIVSVTENAFAAGHALQFKDNNNL